MVAWARSLIFSVKHSVIPISKCANLGRKFPEFLSENPLRVNRVLTDLSIQNHTKVIGSFGKTVKARAFARMTSGLPQKVSLIIAIESDPASIGQATALLEKGGWKELNDVDVMLQEPIVLSTFFFESKFLSNVF